MPQPSFRLSALINQNLAPSPTLHMNQRVQALWAAGRTVYHLGFGESRLPVHPKLIEALRANAHQRSYLAGQGLAALRAQVAQFYSKQLKAPVTPEQVIIGLGSKSLIYALQMALDAELILPTPSWVSYAPQARLLGKAVHMIPATAADHYTWTVDDLHKTVWKSSAANKLLILNSPNNPTGQMFDPAFLAKLADYCRQANVIVLSDEIYALTPHGHRPHVSIAHYYPEGSIVLGGLSKHLSVGGWRLGVAILPNHSGGQQLMQALRVIAGEIWSTPSAPVQYAAITAYGDGPEITAYIQECARIHAIRTQYIWRGLVELGIPCAQPDGAFYMFPNFDRWRTALVKRGVRSSSDLANYLLDTYQIATLPGAAFGVAPPELSLRLASSYLDMETDERAEQILAAYRAGPDPERLMAEHHPNTSEALHRLRQFVEGLA